MGSQGTSTTQNNLEKEKKIVGLTRPDFKTYKATVIKTT